MEKNKRFILKLIIIEVSVFILLSLFVQLSISRLKVPSSASEPGDIASASQTVEYSAEEIFAGSMYDSPEAGDAVFCLKSKYDLDAFIELEDFHEFKIQSLRMRKGEWDSKFFNENAVYIFHVSGTSTSLDDLEVGEVTLAEDTLKITLTSPTYTNSTLDVIGYFYIVTVPRSVSLSADHVVIDVKQG